MILENLDPVTKSFNFNSVSHGQIQAKLWLCHEIEKIVLKENLKAISVRVYGSWYGLLPFLLLSREKISIRHFDLYDIDSDAHQTAQRFLNYWMCEGSTTFSFHTQDVNTILDGDLNSDLIINTSCEHINEMNWWNSIPKSTLFCLQSTNMQHPTHTNPVFGVRHWKSQLNLSHTLEFEGTKKTDYEFFSFERYMLIGRKQTSRRFSFFKKF